MIMRIPVYYSETILNEYCKELTDDSTRWEYSWKLFPIAAKAKIYKRLKGSANEWNECC